MEADEAGTLAALRVRRKEILDPVVKARGGRVVKLMGDGVLVEFASAVAAVEAALALQEGFARTDAETPEDRRIRLRIGINLGEVTGEGGDIFGDGVNVAARLEALAEPGGIAISAKVMDEIRGRLPVTAADMGEQSLKNISRPVRVYRVSQSSAPIQQLSGKRDLPPLPDRPSIAVLPFANLSPDPAHEFFADGMTEDLLTALSRIGELFVVSRNSSFVYKGRAVRIETVARELGVRYVLEGSVRASGDRLRITAQLIDGQSGHHVWAERFDGDTADIFGLQDEITRKIAVALHVKLAYGDLARLWDGQTGNLRAWELMVKARALFLTFDSVDNAAARELLEEAVRLDPDYGGAMVLLGLTWWADARFNASADLQHCLRSANAWAESALQLDPRMGNAHMLKGGVAFLDGRHDEALAQCEEAVTLSPSDSWAAAFLALVHVYSGSAARALELIRIAMRRSPIYPYWYDYVLALASLWTGDLDTALDAAERDARNEADPAVHIVLALVHSFRGETAAAVQAIGRLRAAYPSYTMRDVLRSERYRDPAKLAKVTSSFRDAGLPD
jgi:adenylate cyclase